MDIAYNQHSPHARRSSRSSTNLNHLTLAPLTSRFPLDTDTPQESPHHVSYIEGRSAPTTPSVLAHSSRVSLRRPSTAGLPKSKSSTHLLPNRPQLRPGTTTPGSTKRKSYTKEELDLSTLSGKDRNDSDWLLRAGAAISSSTRESKGQAWLVSRASSTSLTAERDEEEEELQNELAKEREQASRGGSRRGSVAVTVDADDEFSPSTTRRSLSFGPATGTGSRPMSRFGSRANSRRGSRVQLFAPIVGSGQQEGYFDRRDFAQEEFIAEPDFVDAEEDGEEYHDEAEKDEAVVRKLARGSNLGLGGLVERMLGWSLFAVDEDGEEPEEEMMDEKEDSGVSSRTSRLNLRGVGTPMEEKMPILKEGETGGWQDAAWLLSVATKVLL